MGSSGVLLVEDDPMDPSCQSVGKAETVRDPREESRYGAAAVHAGLTVWAVTMSVILFVRAAAIRLSVERALICGIQHETNLNPPEI